MTRKLNILIFVMLSTFYASCKSKNINDENVIKTDQLKKVDRIFNNDKSMVLILDYEITNNPIITYNYKVINSTTKRELKKGVFTGESIEWLNNNTLKCIPSVGMVREEADQVLNEKIDKKVEYITIKIN